MAPRRATSQPARPVEGWAPTLKFRRVSETKIHQAVVRHISVRARPGVVVFHPANGGARSKAEAGRFRAEGVVAGVPDLVLIADGVAYFLELKADKGRVSPVQREMQERLAAAGAKVFTAYGLDAALAQLVAWGLIR